MLTTRYDVTPDIAHTDLPSVRPGSSSPSSPSDAPTQSEDSHDHVQLAVVATINYAVGDTIVLCRGSWADLTDEEDDDLRVGGAKRDFSCLMSTTKKCFQMFCGPARFVNVRVQDLLSSLSLLVWSRAQQRTCDSTIATTMWYWSETGFRSCSR